MTREACSLESLLMKGQEERLSKSSRGEIYILGSHDQVTGPSTASNLE